MNKWDVLRELWKASERDLHRVVNIEDVDNVLKDKIELFGEDGTDWFHLIWIEDGIINRCSGKWTDKADLKNLIDTLFCLRKINRRKVKEILEIVRN